MRDRRLRIFVVLLSVQVAAFIFGLVVSKKLTRGDESSDDFRLASIMGGKEFSSHAAHLRSGTAIACMGGIQLDLRGATLDPAGASLELKTMMGGIEVIVPEDWAVDVDEDVLGGQLEVKVTPSEDLPEDAPKLHVHAVTRIGGTQVTAKAA